MIRKGKKNSKDPKNDRNVESSNYVTTAASGESNNPQELSAGLQTGTTPVEMQKNELLRIREELQSAREMLENSNLILSAMEELSGAAIIATNRDLNIIHWNKAASAMFGWQAEEIYGSDTEPQMRTLILNYLADSELIEHLLTCGSWTGELTLTKKDHSNFKARVNAGILWDNTGNFNGLIALYRTSEDTQAQPESVPQETIEVKVKERTEELVKANRILQQELAVHKRAALLAKESEGKNRDLVDNIKLGIFRCTPGPMGRFLEVNKAMEEISGYSRKNYCISICATFM